MEPLVESEDCQERYPAHKLGGLPAFLQGEPDTEGLLERAVLQEGFRLVLQVEMPCYPEDTGVQYDWPFGDGSMFLVVRRDGGEHQWMALWE